MGAPKQKWTPEEEAALKAGVLKHGPGKWRTILKDQEFSGVLYLRSNVDLKDKWRNMSVIANGWGSREKARLAVKRMQQLPKKDENSFALMSVTLSGEDIVGSPKSNSSKRSIIRLDNLILEAINNLKEPGGSNKTNIGSYIEEQYWAPPNFERLLSAKLKFLTASGKLIKMKRKYSIAPTSAASEKQGHLSMSLLEGRQRDSPRDNADDDGFTNMKSGIEAEIAKMRSMTTMEAAAVAAKAIAEAEFALAQAKQAAREAEEAEADAEAAQAFAEAVEDALQDRSYGEPVMT